MNRLRAWIDRKYYSWKPDILFIEAVDCLEMTYANYIGYAQCVNRAAKAHFLIQLTLERSDSSDLRKHHKLRRYLLDLCDDKGW